MPLTISSPLRILVLRADENTPFPSPFADPALTTHEIRTPYYHASVPVWRDSLPSTSSADGEKPSDLATALEEWKKEWTLPEAAEVVTAVGAWVLCFRRPRHDEELESIKTLLRTVHETITHHLSATYSSLDPLFLAVGMHAASAPSLEIDTEDWEDLCRDEGGGWEWIDGTIGPALTSTPTTTTTGPTTPVEKDGIGEAEEKKKGQGGRDGMNEYGEKVGIARLIEALEANEWEGEDENDADADADAGDVGFDFFNFDKEDQSISTETPDRLGLGFGQEAGEVQSEMWGVQQEIRKQREQQPAEDKRARLEEEEEGEGEGDVQLLESMMVKMQAVRDHLGAGADMPEGERRRVAKRAVGEVMRSMEK